MRSVRYPGGWLLAARRPARIRLEEPLTSTQSCARFTIAFEPHPNADKTAAVQGHDSEHHGLLRHGAGPRRRVHHGVARPGSRTNSRTHKVQLDAFWMQAHEVTWDEYRLFMFANQAGEIAHKDELVDARQPAHAALRRDELRHGHQRLPGHQHDAARRQQVRRVAERQDRRILSPADRGRMGIRLPRRHDRRILRRSATTPGTPPTAAASISQGRDEEAECLGSLRHARQRHGVDARSVRALQGRRRR